MSSNPEFDKYTLEELKQGYLDRLQLSEVPTMALEAERARREEQMKAIQEGARIAWKQDLAERFCSFLIFTAEHFSTTVSDMTGPARNQRLADARHVGMFVAMKVYRMSQKDVATLFSRKDHSSAIHARKVVTNRPELLEEAKVLESKWINRNRNN
jgi:chromosomal replication initiation ATPase DnaA